MQERADERAGSPGVGSDERRRAIREIPLPTYVTWELTRRCNAYCVYCHADAGPDASTSHDLTTAEAMALIEELAGSGVKVLTLSGGEPMLRRDWRLLVARAVHQGLFVSICTNGAMVTERVAHDLSDLGVESVVASLDSHRPSVHDAIRRFPGLHRRATSAIERLSAQGVRVIVSFTPTRLNQHEGAGVVELACQLGARGVNLSHYVPLGRGTMDLALTPGEVRAILVEWLGFAERYRDRMQVLWHDCRVAIPTDQHEAVHGCEAGHRVARIGPDGAVTPCVFLPTIIGSCRHRSFREMWTRSPLLAAFRERVGRIHGVCGECTYLGTCGGCRALAYAYNGGDSLAGDPYCWLRLPSSTAGAAGERTPGVQPVSS